MSQKRAVITGIGVVSPAGVGKDVFWASMREAKSFVERITSFDPSQFPCQVAAEASSFEAQAFFDDWSELKRMGRSAHMAVAAASLAIKDAGISLEDKSPNRKMGVFLGSATSGLEYVERDFRTLERAGPGRVRPYLGIAGFGGAVSSEVSRSLGIRGPSITVSTGCTASTDAMGIVLDGIRSGRVEAVVAGGVDACVTPGILSAFCQMGAVSFSRNGHSGGASRPFNLDRDGFVLGEGAWIFVIEEMQAAVRRKARIYAELAGYAATCDAWHMSKPHPSGDYTAEALRLAIKDASLTPNQVEMYSAYGNGTPINDSYETRVVKKVFGDRAYKIPVVSIKSMFGHPLGASGAQEMAGALLAITSGFVHPTINYEVPDPECDLDYVPNMGRKQQVQVVVCNSIAFGAKNSAVVMRAFLGK